jgi:DNA-binding SARP family transcriptional activator
MRQIWRIELFGGLRIRGRETVIERFRTRKTGALLAYLAFYAERTHSRDELTAVFWPEDEPESARHKLSVALSALRQQLEPPGVPDSGVIVADRVTLRIQPGAIVTDAREFLTWIEDAARHPTSPGRVTALQRAVELYRGELLPGYQEEWLLAEQRRLEAEYVGALRALVTLLQELGQFSEAIAYACRALSLDPWREDFHSLLMRVYVAEGRPAEALRQYRELRGMLRAEFSISPSEETRSLAAEIRRTFALSEEPEETFPEGLPTVVSEGSYPLAGATKKGQADRGVPVSGDRFPTDEPAPLGGAVPLHSRYYMERPVDAELRRALSRRTSIILVKGASQVGKTSLLARGLQQARHSGARVVWTDFDSFNGDQFRSAETLLQAAARGIAEQTGWGGNLAEVWDAEDGANMNFRRFIRRVLAEDAERPFVWGLDGVDRLFGYSFSSEVFALFRSWHNERALDPTGPWSLVTLAIAYATEARLFIADLNQSPFNVGTRLVLDDLSLEQITELNARYGLPLHGPAEIGRFFELLGGHPYLVQRALQELSGRQMSLELLVTQAEQDNWIFGDHLRRMRVLLLRDEVLCEAVRRLLKEGSCPDPEAFYRLRSAGLLTGEAASAASWRCSLYSRYLTQHLLWDA